MGKRKIGECIFCGETRKLTGEHLWPDWLRRRLTPTSRNTRVRHTKSSTFEGSDPSTWEAPPFKLEVPEVCEECNTGWMSDLESVAAPILTPMLAGQRTALDQAHQKILARWLVKTAMVYQATTEHEAIKPHQYRYLAQQFRPPPSAQVWLAGRTAEEPRPAIFRIRTSEIRPDPNKREPGDARFDGYVVTIAIFHFVGQVFGHDLPFDSPWARTGHFGSALQEIWPLSGPITWPPPDLIRTGIDNLTDDPEFERHLTRILASRGIELRLGPAI